MESRTEGDNFHCVCGKSHCSTYLLILVPLSISTYIVGRYGLLRYRSFGGRARERITASKGIIKYYFTGFYMFAAAFVRYH